MIELYNMDCMEYMRGQPDNAFDLALTDPPYGVGFKYSSHKDTADGYYEWCDLWFTELQRISKCQVLTVGYANNRHWFCKDPKHAILWIKPNSCTRSPLNGYSCYELVFVFGETKKRIFKDYIIAPVKIQKKADFHPCPKELSFWTKLQDCFVEKGDKVLDIFMGSGTTAISSHQLGCDFVGCEIDPEYYKAAKDRIDRETRQVAMF